jgi:hypothetical protein
MERPLFRDEVKGGFEIDRGLRRRKRKEGNPRR